MAGWIDTHAHLDDRRLLDQIQTVLADARSAGVVGAIAVGTTRDSSQACLGLARQFPDFLRSSAGIHPNNAAATKPTDWDDVVRLAADPDVCALGETGLDRHWHDTPFPMQEDFFARHLELGRKLGKAVIIHCREADADMRKALREAYDRHGPIRGVMHSFASDAVMAADCLAMGLYLSFSGVLTYKNAETIREAAKLAPADRILVETDAPYLAPVPKRGKRNEPAFVRFTGEFLAEVRGEPADTTAKLTTQNAIALFGLPPFGDAP